MRITIIIFKIINFKWMNRDSNLFKIFIIISKYKQFTFYLQMFQLRLVDIIYIYIYDIYIIFTHRILNHITLLKSAISYAT